MHFDTENLRKRFDYEEKTGHLIHKRKVNDKVGPGTPAGRICSDGYRYLCTNRKRAPIHQMIWYWHGRTIPSRLELDHIDRDPANNRIENLRCVTHKENMNNVNWHSEGAIISQENKERPNAAGHQL